MRQSLTNLAFTALVVAIACGTSVCQGKVLKLGVELQGYPTGFIPGVRADMYLSEFSKVHFRAGYNIVRHGDAGEHQDERGGGPGATIGYDILPINHRWTIGLRTDLWFNKVDWSDIQPVRTGSTDVTVLQPTVQVGFRLPAGESVEFVPTLSFGYEFNIHTRGEEVGHGPIFLLGVIVNFEL
jgi:hypothetical protein